VQDEFDRIPGVISTEVGYTGGKKDHPSYEQVCSGYTGHTEAVKVVFELRKITFKALVNEFLKNHTPASDIEFMHGGQYLTAIFCVNAQQEKEVRSLIEQSETASHRKLNVTVRRSGIFWRAEEYHQHYYRKNGLGVCGIH
jgi:methionine-S-sulfoxide reductase